MLGDDDFDHDDDHEDDDDHEELEEEWDPVENRVYLFRELATAFIGECGAMLASVDKDERKRAQKALSMLAFVSCVVADSADEEPEEVARRIANGP